MEVDITGLTAKPKENWQDRVEKWAKPEFFTVSVHIKAPLWTNLSSDEKDRLLKYIKLVQEAASYMAAGMLKGVLKYGGGDRDLDQWFAYLVGEGADQMNYQMLLFDAYRQKREAEKEQMAREIVGEFREKRK